MSEKPRNDAFAIRGPLSGLRSPDVYDGLGFGLIFSCMMPGTVAFMCLTGDHYHQVEQNYSQSWERYSMVVYFGNK